ncbi:MAG: coproporphyrinogen III oxidase family protein [Deltaproteobacteria bacterium]|nr:coproporphyrinogen III oxidase family protein [Deltaproteobacteria bacterium]
MTNLSSQRLFPGGPPGAPVEGLYLHVPFCHSICPFCAFAVHGNRPDLHGVFHHGLVEEARWRAQTLAPPSGGVASVYVGGGTPSTLALPELEELLAGVFRWFPPAPTAEIAVEINPEDATPDYLAGLARLGVNRVSLGIQSLNGAALAALGRRHTPAQALAALAAAAEWGPGHWNADFMLGVPGVSSQVFLQDLQQVLAFQPPHLSTYLLEFEPGTLFTRRAARVRGPEQAIEQDTQREEAASAYLAASRQLSGAGWNHYEVSNYCRPGREGRQNLLVWNGGSYLGLGPGAHSWVGSGGGLRWHNPRHLKAWLAGVENTRWGEDPAAGWEQPTPAQRADETLMLALRRKEGLNVAAWSQAHGQPWGEPRQKIAQELIRAGLAMEQDGRLALTPQGFLLADEITARFSGAQ